MTKTITVLDLGSSKIAGLTAKIEPDGSIVPLALENVDSRGIKAGDVTDTSKAAGDITSLAARLRRGSKKNIKNICALVRGLDVRMFTSRGMVVLGKIPREIAKKDMERCLAIASIAKIPSERVPIQTVISGFFIDGGKEKIANPLGLSALKLEAEMLIPTVKRSKIDNFSRCLHQAGLFLEATYLSSLSAAEAVLEEREKENGAMLLDIGSSVTEGLVFRDGTLENFKVIDLGASNMSDGRGALQEEKLENFLGWLKDYLGSMKGNIGSLVVTGGGALKDGLLESIERTLNIPTRMGMLKNVGYTLSSQDMIVHTSTLGMAYYIAKEFKYSNIRQNPVKKALRKAIEIYNSYF